MAKKDDKKVRHPLPGAVLAGKWEIEESVAWAPMRAGCTFEKDKRVMMVPLGSTRMEFLVRAHEMAHVRFSPEEKPKKNVEAYLAIEEARVNALGERATGVNLTASMDEAPRAFQMSMIAQDRAGRGFEEAPLRVKALRWIAVGPRSKVGQKIKKMLDKGIETMNPAQAHFLSELETTFDALRSGEIGDTNVAFWSKKFDELFPVEKPVVPGLPSMAGGKKSEGIRLTGDWAPMEIVQARMDMTKITPVKRRRAMDMGCVPTKMYRMPSDQKVFERKMKRPLGGTVLVDVSGSMHWAIKDLGAVLKNAPGSTLAIYSGDGDKGRLVIIGKNGKMATMKEIGRLRSGSGNCVDGPALKWLGTMPEPRLWVSDGGVTGIGDNRSMAVERDARRLVEEFVVKQVKTTREAVKLLVEKKGGR